MFSSIVLEHVEDIDFSASEIYRVICKGGRMVSVVPFINHVHGSPYDYHRPTRFGWLSILKKAGWSDISIFAVDNRFQCVINLMTSAINNSVYSLLRKIKNASKIKGDGKSRLNEGGASPESGKKLAVIYLIMKMNPINFMLGLISLVLGIISTPDAEGEITSGYLIVARK